MHIFVVKSVNSIIPKSWMRCNEGDLGRSGLLQDQTHSQRHVCIPQRTQGCTRRTDLLTIYSPGPTTKVRTGCVPPRLAMPIVQKVHVQGRPDSWCQNWRSQLQTRVLRRLLEFIYYWLDVGDHGDDDDGALSSDQELFLVCTNNYFNLLSECRSIKLLPLLVGRSIKYSWPILLLFRFSVSFCLFVFHI